jgi:hypothetical protein
MAEPLFEYFGIELHGYTVVIASEEPTEPPADEPELELE